MGAGYGTASPWPFEVRVEAAAEAGYRSIGMGEADYSGMRASGITDDELLDILERHGIWVAEIEFMFDWMHDDERAAVPAAIAENLFHTAEVFRPDHVNVGDVRFPPGLPMDLVADRFRSRVRSIGAVRGQGGHRVHAVDFDPRSRYRM